MGTSLWKNIDTLSAYTEVSSMKEMLKGKWYKYQSDFVRVTILKDLVLITSSIATASTVVNLELPEHDKFFIHIDSASGTTLQVVEANAALSLTVEASQSIWAFFNYK